MDLQMIGLGILKISTEIYFLCKTKKGLLMDVANKLEWGKRPSFIWDSSADLLKSLPRSRRDQEGCFSIIRCLTALSYAWFQMREHLRTNLGNKEELDGQEHERWKWKKIDIFTNNNMKKINLLGMVKSCFTEFSLKKPDWMQLGKFDVPSMTQT